MILQLATSKFYIGAYQRGVPRQPSFSYALWQLNSQLIRLAPAQNLGDVDELVDFIRNWVAPETKIFSDEWNVFGGMRTVADNWARTNPLIPVKTWILLIVNHIFQVLAFSYFCS